MAALTLARVFIKKMECLIISTLRQYYKKPIYETL